MRQGCGFDSQGKEELIKVFCNSRINKLNFRIYMLIDLASVQCFHVISLQIKNHKTSKLQT